MKTYAYHYLVTLLVFVVGDGLWLGLVAKNFYAKHLGYIMTDKPDWLAAIAFYLLFIAALTYFVVSPAVGARTPVAELVFRAGFFGLATYATYDLTNQATLAGWPIILTAVDLSWGAVLSATVAVVATQIIGRF